MGWFTLRVDRLSEIRRIIARHVHDGYAPTALPGVFVGRATNPSPPVGDVLQPAFVLIAGGAKHTALNGQVYRYGAGDYCVASVDLPVVGNITAADDGDPYLAVGFALDPGRIASLLLDTAGSRVPSDTRSPSAFGVGHASPALLDATLRLLYLLEEPEDIAALHAGLEREILWRLLRGPQGAAIRQIGTADSRVTHLNRAIRLIRENYEQPLRIRDLAATAAMSLSSFHRHFLALTSMTPLEYQKQLRLNEAHVRLMTGGQDVGTVAASVGYASPSQFSREYRRMFAIAPRETIAAAS